MIRPAAQAATAPSVGRETRLRGTSNHAALGRIHSNRRREATCTLRLLVTLKAEHQHHLPGSRGTCKSQQTPRRSSWPRGLLVRSQAPQGDDNAGALLGISV